MFRVGDKVTVFIADQNGIVKNTGRKGVILEANPRLVNDETCYLVKFSENVKLYLYSSELRFEDINTLYS